MEGQRPGRPLQLPRLGSLFFFAVLGLVITEEGNPVILQGNTGAQFLQVNCKRRKRNQKKWDFRETKMCALESLLQ